jgi:hypothetical protein
MNKLYVVFKILLFLSFFLPFVKSCGLIEKKAETASVDSTTVDTTFNFEDSINTVDTLFNQDSLLNNDTAGFTKDTVDTINIEEENKHPILNFIFNSIIMPDYTDDVSMTGFGIFYITVLSFFQKGLEKFELASLILPLTFILSLIHIFIRTNKMNTLIIINFFIHIGLVSILFLFGIEDLLFGFWTILTLASTTFILIWRIKKDYAANTVL